MAFVAHCFAQRSRRWLLLCSITCACDGSDDVRLTPSAPDAAAPAAPDGDASPDTGGTAPGTPTRGCQSASECTSFDERAVDCVAITDDFRACAVAPPVPATEATRELYDECGPQRPCSVGTCYTLSVAATNQCAAGGFDVYNVCVRDGCASDADCPDDGYCAPGGVVGTIRIERFPHRHCVPAACKQSSDCAAQPGGFCALLPEACARTSGSFGGFQAAQLVCVYPNGCTRDDDCPSAHYCGLLDSEAVCLPF